MLDIRAVAYIILDVRAGGKILIPGYFQTT
jgi:hypothetical protein